MKSDLMRIIALFVAIVMIMTCFSSCKKEPDGEKVTRPSDIEAPIDDENINLDDLLGDDTSGENITIITEDTTNAPSNNGTTSGGSTSGGSTSGGSTSGGSTSGGSTSGGSTSGGSTSGGTANISKEDLNAALHAVGYEYDAEQQIYYSTLNPWQRHFGFGDQYDQAAVYANMKYTTIKIDFPYDGLLWRLQWWKGQYGVLEGAEMGVYTKDPKDASTTFYDCASDEQLLTMSFEYYKNANDFNNNNRLFIRQEQEHWWLTGFKFGYTDPKKNVIKATVIAYDTEMADGIEEGLKNVKDSKGNWNGFVKYRSGTTAKNVYVRNGNKFTVVWYDAGYQNYTSSGATVPDPVE